MKWVLLVVFAFVCLLIIVLFTKIKILINYYHGQDNDHLKVKFQTLFGIIHYTIDIPVIKIDDDSPTIIIKETDNQMKDEQVSKQFSVDDLLESFQKSKNLFKHIIDLHHVIRHFLKKVRIKQVEWHTVVGSGDAALTGMLIGAIWTAKGAFVALISTYMKLEQLPNFTITPNFQAMASQTSFKCIIQFRIGHAILAGISMIRLWRSNRMKSLT